MPYRVVQWSTGNVGRHALAGIDAHPELAAGRGLRVHPVEGRPRRRGAGRPRPQTLGVAGTNDADALLALKPDCIVHTAWRTTGSSRRSATSSGSCSGLQRGVVQPGDAAVPGAR